MDQTPTSRFIVQVEAGGGHGDLYELEETTYYRVIDTQSHAVVLTFTGEMSASLSTSNGQWENYEYSGVSEVSLAPDEQSVRVKYHNGQEERVPLPHSPDQRNSEDETA